MKHFLKKSLLSVMITAIAVIGFNHVAYGQTPTISPARGAYTIEEGDSFVLEIDYAGITGVARLEVDHSLEGSFPEFHLAADDENPYESPEDATVFANAGVSATHSGTKWTIDFGEVLTDTFVANGGITFHLALEDGEAAYLWGDSNSDGMIDGDADADNTFVYTLSRPLEPSFILEGSRSETVSVGGTYELNRKINFANYTVANDGREKLVLTIKSGNFSNVALSTIDWVPVMDGEDIVGLERGLDVAITTLPHTFNLNLNLLDSLTMLDEGIPVDLKITGNAEGTYVFNVELIGVGSSVDLGDFTLTVQNPPASSGSSGSSKSGGRSGSSNTTPAVSQNPTWQTELAKFTTVAEIQAFLNAKGFGPLTVDGMFGDSTALAIDAYKKSFGETTTPVQTPSSTTKLETVVLLKLGVRGEDVRKLQMILNEKGFGPLATDGIFGQGTRAAVIKFQIANGLSSDGIVGAMTQSALNK